MTAHVYLEKEGAHSFAQEPYIWPMRSTNVSVISRDLNKRYS
jgi:hypothetical protein